MLKKTTKYQIICRRLRRCQEVLRNTPLRPRVRRPEAEGPHERCASTARSGRGTTTAPPRDPGTPPGPSGGVSESRPPTQENARRRPPAPGRGRRAPRRTGRPRAPPGTTRTRQVTDCTSLGRGRNPEKAGRRGGACGPHADPGPAGRDHFPRQHLRRWPWTKLLFEDPRDSPREQRPAPHWHEGWWRAACEPVSPL